MSRWMLAICACLAILGVGRADETPRLRRPVALALAEAGATLLIANRDAGSVSVVDVRSHTLSAELRVGRKLSDLCLTPDGRRAFVADEEAGEVITLEPKQGTWRETFRRKVGHSPVNIRLTDEGLRLVVACLWARQVRLFAVSDQGELGRSAEHVFDLPFAPRLQRMLPDPAKCLVADAFGGKLAVLDLDRKKIDSLRSLPNHNIRGLALGRERKTLVFSHQLLHAQGRPNPGEIQSGSMLANTLRKMPLTMLLDPFADFVGSDKVFSLGDVERGAGDPGDLLQTSDGKIVVALAGTGEVAVGRPEEVLWTRIPVGVKPIALALAESAGRVYVANMFSDSISAIDLRQEKVIAEISLGKTPILSAEERGEILFHNANLSFESWLSCHSCHTDGHTNGRLNDNLSDGSFGTPKRVLSLLGARDTGPWAWNAKVTDLEAQVRNSILSTMQGKKPKEEDVRDLAAYLRTLTPPPALAKARGEHDDAALQRGQKVFTDNKCAACHAPPTFTSDRVFDVGLRDEVGGTRFNPPSLRGVSQAGPYFHDNRAGSLEEIFTRHRHPVTQPLSSENLKDLVYFLRNQ